MNILRSLHRHLGPLFLVPLLSSHGAGRLSSHSAGLQPSALRPPQSLAHCRNRAMKSAIYAVKAGEECACPQATVIDLVITVRNAAANATCPVWPATRGPQRMHWGGRSCRGGASPMAAGVSNRLYTGPALDFGVFGAAV